MSVERSKAHLGYTPKTELGRGSGLSSLFFFVLSNQQPTLIYVLLSVTIPHSQKVGTPRTGGPLVWWRPRAKADQSGIAKYSIGALLRVVTV